MVLPCSICKHFASRVFFGTQENNVFPSQESTMELTATGVELSLCEDAVPEGKINRKVEKLSNKSLWDIVPQKYFNKRYVRTFSFMFDGMWPPSSGVP